MNTELSRRSLLAGAFMLAFGPLAWWGCGRASERSRGAVLELARREDLLDGAPTLGRAYLELHPAEADPDLLNELLFDGHPGSADLVAAGVAERIGRDWQELDVVQVEGWLLARAEARFLALVTLLAEQVPPEG